jgi:hypothetical protein
VVAETNTFCDDWESKDSHSIRVPPKWTYEDDEIYLKFKEDATSHHHDGKVIGIVVKTTVVPPSTINGKPYDCSINGNG